MIYLELRPIPGGSDYKKELLEIQAGIDSLKSRNIKERAKTDSLILVKEYYHETKEIRIKEIQNLPLDSAVELLRKNLYEYEKTGNPYVSVPDSTNVGGSRDDSK